jgi:hypothetical protein
MKTVNRGSWSVIREKLWRFALRRARAIVDAADEWIHAQEMELIKPAQVRETLAEVDVVASAARERVHKRTTRAARPRLRQGSGGQARQPRLKYQGGQFVRQQ